MDDDHKRLKRFHSPGDLHELTFSCSGRRPLLADEKVCKLLCQSIDQAMSRHRHQLIAFVFMREHVHLLVLPTSIECDIAGLLFAIKRPFSYRVKRHYEATHSDLRSELVVREREGKSAFRFWQEEPATIAIFSSLNPLSRQLITSISIRFDVAWWPALAIGNGRAVGGT